MRRRPLGPRLQHRRGPARHRPRGPGAGAARRLRHPLHLLRSRWSRRLTLHKGMTKRVLRDAGVPTPAFAVVADARRARRRRPAVPAVRQAGGRGHRQGHRRPLAWSATRRELRARCRDAAARASASRSLVEPYLPGREFTVGIIGTGAGRGRSAPWRSLLLAGRRAGRLHLRQQGALRGAGASTARRPSDGRGREAEALALRRLARLWAAATAAASTCGATPTGGPSSSRSTRWPGCTPSTPTCP